MIGETSCKTKQGHCGLEFNAMDMLKMFDDDGIVQSLESVWLTVSESERRGLLPLILNLS